MADGTRHISDEELHDPASYLSVRPGDRVYDLYGWEAGHVVEPRIVATRDEFFDGIVVDFRGRHLFVDSPEVRAIHQGVVVLDLTVADLVRAANDQVAPPHWPGGPLRAPARRATLPATPEDADALKAALAHLYAVGRLSLATLEREIERALTARTCADLDAIAGELLAVPAGVAAPPGGDAF